MQTSNDVNSPANIWGYGFTGFWFGVAATGFYETIIVGRIWYCETCKREEGFARDGGRWYCGHCGSPWTGKKRKPPEMARRAPSTSDRREEADDSDDELSINEVR